jgi:hypothetical protein
MYLNENPVTHLHASGLLYLEALLGKLVFGVIGYREFVTKLPELVLFVNLVLKHKVSSTFFLVDFRFKDR